MSCGEYCIAVPLEQQCCRVPYIQIKQHEIVGGFQLRKQCITCGCIQGQSVKKSEYPNHQRFELTNKQKHEEYSQNRYKEGADRVAKYKAYFLDNRETAKLKRYDAYLNSPEWANKRQLVLQRDNHICQSCLQPTATQVHHLHYTHLYNEPLFELVSVCVPCHESITAMDKGQSCEPIQYPIFASF
jgi:5-methylcytosine-specific restriction endonuclease McrA